VCVCVCVLVAGVAVSSMMFGTTVLMYMVMLMIWETNFFLATAFLIGFGFIDMVFTTGLHQLPCRCWSALGMFVHPVEPCKWPIASPAIPIASKALNVKQDRH